MPAPLAPPPKRWHRDLIHPLPLGAVAMLAINDHLLKGAGVLPPAVTGKVSDLAGLFFFPLLLAALARLASRPADGWAAVLTAIGFAAVKLVPAVNALVASTWGAMVMDPTDLVALPSAGLAWLWMRRRARGGPPARPTGRLTAAGRALGVVAAAAASIATGAPARAPVALPQTAGARLAVRGCSIHGTGTVEAEIDLTPGPAYAPFSVAGLRAVTVLRPDVEAAAFNVERGEVRGPARVIARFELPGALGDAADVGFELDGDWRVSDRATCTRKPAAPVAQ